MSFKKKLLSTAMTVAMASGFAISQNASAVSLAEDGVGQLLLAPYYTTLNGYQTKFAIYNTRDDVAVKAKVVIRSYGHSIESRDFICYLTPGDVCRFEIVNDGGQAYLTSSDDSVRNQFGGWAYDPDVAAKGQPQVPLKIILEDSKMLKIDKFDYNEVGHVEVIGLYAVRGATYKVGSDDVKVVRGMKKADLAKIFDIFSSPDGIDVWNAIDNITGTGVLTVPAAAAGTFPPISNTYISSVGILNPTHPQLRISGNVTVVKSDSNGVVDRMGYRIPALTDGVVTNALFDAGISGETPIGLRFGAGFSHTIIAIEQALAATRLRSTYDATPPEKTGSIVTFPTKYLHRGTSICGDAVDFISYSAPFNANGLIPYSLNVYDNHENVKTETLFFSPSASPYFPAEVNYFMPNWFANSGQFVVGINPENNRCFINGFYAGAPVLSFTHEYIDKAGTPTNSVLIPTVHE